MKASLSPGIALYHQGMDLVALYCTNTNVWELQVRGQLMNNTWVNIGIVFSPKNGGELSVSFHVQVRDVDQTLFYRCT